MKPHKPGTVTPRHHERLDPSDRRDALAARYRTVRAQTMRLIETLEPEDMVIQSTAEVSPTRWHLAHTTWFFETFILRAFATGYESPDDRFNYLFNSYYNTVGAQFPRAERGHLSRPTVREVIRYRQYVDQALVRFLQRIAGERREEVAPLIEIGLQHEQQHQELMLTDIKHVFACNPLRPVYRTETSVPDAETLPIRWASYAEGLREIGYAGDGFCYDNEQPRHRTFLEGFELASRPVTCGEYLEFMAAGGYERSELWLDAGWQEVQRQGWAAPLYWALADGAWFEFTLNGRRPIRPTAPVCHVSFFEADAYARWRGMRLPTEAEWEVAASWSDLSGGNFVEAGHYHPRPQSAAAADATPQQMFGDVWEWTASQYRPYPGYQPPAGALGEYNGKFMCNQFVLKGGSCATPASHMRLSYRNFFEPAARWQFTGFRLAK